MTKHQKHQSIVYNANGVEFTIYATPKPTKSGPKVYWVLEERLTTGNRRLLNNKTLKAAKERADKIRAAMVKGQASRMSLSNGQWQDVCIAVEILRSTQTCDSLGSAIRSWAECIGMLGDRATLLDAVKFYLAHYKGNGPQPKPIRFDEAAKRYHAFKVADGKSASHCGNILSRMNRLTAKLPAGITTDEPTAGQLDHAVVSLGIAPKTRNEYRIMLSNFFKWCGKQNPPFVPRGFNPAKEMERYDVPDAEVEFLHVGELRRVLTVLPAKRPDLLPLVTLVCFAGLRPSEAARVEWREIGEDYIRLPGKKSKTGEARQIPVHENLKAWLALWRKESGLICPDVSLEHVNAAIRRHSGIRLPHDAMRHSYGTHRQRVVKNIGAVAEEMGNTIVICKRHYVNAFCSDAEAAEWFSVVPASPGNVISLSEARSEAEHPRDAIGVQS